LKTGKLINTFCHLNSSLQEIQNSDEVLKRALDENPWFTEENSKMAISAVCSWLDEKNLRSFSAKYGSSKKPMRVGLVLAGNLPLVGFHDILCVLLSGHHAQVKPSIKDKVLIEALVNSLFEIDPGLRENLDLVEKLSGIEAFIGTGSNNTNRYFDHYFGKHPHIFRKNRTSIAVLSGKEKTEDFHMLGKDIFSYFGFGCRNVSKIFIPEGFRIPSLLDEFQSYSGILDHNKFANNYQYRRAIYLTGGEKFLDTGFLIVKESESPFSHIAELNYEFYYNEEDLLNKIERIKDNIQLVIGKKMEGLPHADFGQSQFPGIEDFADGVDTMNFLVHLDKTT
jgi:Acyl-CoA reductase (LuxC)